MEGQAEQVTMTEKQQSKPSQRQPYDSSFKALLDDQTLAFLSYFLEEEIIEAQELKESIVKEGTVEPSLRVDGVYQVRRRERAGDCVGHVEFESAPTRETDGRLFEYYGGLYRKYRKPVLQTLICPFEGYGIPIPPLKVELDGKTLAEINYKVIELYKREAQELLDKGNVAVYAILPTMKGANFDRLVQGLQEMKEYYKEQEGRFSGHFVWFSTFLYRSTIVSEEHKERIKQKMKEIGSLHEGNPLLEELKAEGEAQGLRTAVLTSVRVRFPALTELAQQKVTSVTSPDILNFLLEKIVAAPDETIARFLLETEAA